MASESSHWPACLLPNRRQETVERHLVADLRSPFVGPRKILDKMDRDKLMRMANAVRTGGKGTVRRKKKAVHKATSTDDKRLQSTLKRLGVNTIPGIEEVNLFQSDGMVVHFVNPKVQASIAANTYVVSGPSQVKSLQELVPGILNQIGGEGIANLTKGLSAQFPQAGGAAAPAIEEDEDDDVPDLVDNFEEASK